MPSPRDPYETGPRSYGDPARPDANIPLTADWRQPYTQHAPSEQGWTFNEPDKTVPLSQLPPTKPPRQRRPNERLIWYAVICGIVLIGVALGVMFTAPLRAGQQKSTVQNATTSTQSTASSSPTPTQSTFTPGSYDSVKSRLFSSTSPWNVPIGTNVQLDPFSSDMVNLLSDGGHVATLYQFGMPIYTSTASDPTYTIKDTGNDDTFNANQPIHIPDSAAPSPGSDHWMFIYDKTKNMIFEMWNTSKQGNTWTTQTANVYNPTGDGVLQSDGSTQNGNGASYFGGVVTQADIERGYINHALSFASEYTSTDSRYPMHNSDGHGNDAHDFPMGARLQLDTSVDCDTLPNASKGEMMICKALQTYGGNIRDTGGVALSVYFEGEDLNDPSRNPPNTPGDPSRSGGIYNTVSLKDGTDLPAIPWSKLHVLKAWNSYTPLSASAAAALLSLDIPTGNSVTRIAFAEDVSRRKSLTEF